MKDYLIPTNSVTSDSLALGVPKAWKPIVDGISKMNNFTYLVGGNAHKSKAGKGYVAFAMQVCPGDNSRLFFFGYLLRWSRKSCERGQFQHLLCPPRLIGEGAVELSEGKVVDVKMACTDQQSLALFLTEVDQEALPFSDLFIADRRNGLRLWAKVLKPE